MPLDVFPQSPVYATEVGTFWVTFLPRDASGVAIVRAGISSWELRVYDEGAQSPETPIYSSLARLNTETNTDGSNIWLTSVTVNGLSRVPQGHTFQEQYVSRYPAVGGKTYVHEYTLFLASNGGKIVHRQQVVVEPAYQ